MKLGKISPSLHVWTDAQCETLMEEVYKVLETIGCDVKSAAARSILQDAGCSIDEERVKIPKKLLIDAIASTPKQITLYDRDGSPAMILDTEHTYYGPPISTVYVTDCDTLETRKGTRKDAYNAGLICEALEHCGWASAMSGISDGVSSLSDVYEVYELLKSTKKPLMYWATSPGNLKLELAMFEAVSGKEAIAEKPTGICLVCPMDPWFTTRKAQTRSSSLQSLVHPWSTSPALPWAAPLQFL